MDVHLLGEIAATGASSYALGGPTQRRVLAALALRANEVVSVSTLVDVVWGEDEPPDRAEHNVRTYVHRLRTALGDDGERVETVPGGYRVRLDASDLDITRFAQHIETGFRLLDTADHASGLDQLDAAASLWRGEPLAEFATENWAQPTAVRLKELYSRLRERRAQALLEVGRPADAVPLLETLVREEPLREQPRGLLMRALYESGRQAEALRSFQDFRRFLIDEIGIEPSPELTRIDHDIAAGRFTETTPTRTVGSYELHERIGEGGFAVVHRATQESLGREVAVKIVKAELANDPEFIRRFEAEARMVAHIEHPSVVPLYDYWREPDRAFLVMRWMTGGSLHELLDDGPLPIDRALDIVDQVAAALDAAHDRSIVHRDVKPENILFDDAGRAFLGDFGIALMADERQRPEAALSEGSPMFASPEQLRRQPAGPEADVHALGIVAFAMFAGHTPFADAPNEQTLLRRQLDEPLPPLSSIRGGLPTRVDNVIAIATAKSPENRFPTASGFAVALRAAVEDEPAPATADRPRSNPYKGLAAFDESDAADFHGRARVVAEVIERLSTPHTNLLALVGPSGSGKSSLARAGVLPAARAGAIPGSGRWFTSTMTPGVHPFEALETALLRVAVNPPAALLEQLQDGERGILRTVRRLLPADDGVVLLLIDQFEELFTLTTPRVAERFLDALAEAVSEPGSPLRLVLTLRADFYDQPLQHARFAPLLKQHTVVLTPLAPDELERAIVAPADAVGVGFAPGLVAKITAEVHDQPGALPLLQYALTQAFDATDSNTIELDTWLDIGGMSGALARRADELWHRAGADAQTAIRRLFGRLVNVDDTNNNTRRRVPINELDIAAHSALDPLGAARLLTFDHDPATREPTVEVAHEALIREWHRLQTWLDEDRETLRTHRHLTGAATTWSEGGRDAGDLYRGARLELAESLTTAESLALNQTEHDFLNASTAARTEAADGERRRVQRLRRLLTATALIATLAVAASLLAIDRQRASQNAQQSADVERVRATSFELLSTDPALALLLATEAYRLDPTQSGGSALHRHLTNAGGFAAAVPGNYRTVDLVEGGRVAVVASDQSIQVVDLASRESVLTVDRDVNIDTAVAAADTPAGPVAAAWDEAGLDVFDLQTGDLIAHDAEEPLAVGLDPIGGRLAVATRNRTIEIRSALDQTGPPSLVIDQIVATDLFWSPDGDQLLVLGQTIGVGLPSPKILLFDTASGEQVWDEAVSFSEHIIRMEALFAPEGGPIVVTADDNTAASRSTTLLLDRESGDATTEALIAAAGISGLTWIDVEARRVLAVQESSAIEIDLAGGRLRPSPFPTAATADWHFSAPLGRYVEAGPLGLRLWATSSVDLVSERFPLTPEQAPSATSGFQLDPHLIDDGAAILVSSRSTAFQPIVRYELASGTATSTDRRGILRSSPDRLSATSGSLILFSDQFTLAVVDESLQPQGLGPNAQLDLGFAMVSRDGAYLTADWALRPTEIVDTRTGEVVSNPVVADGRPNAKQVVFFAPNGERVAVTQPFDGDTWAIVETRTGAELLRGTDTGYVRPRYAGDRLYVEPLDEPGAFDALDPETFESTGIRFKGHQGGLAAIWDLVDEGIVITKGADTTVRVWDRSTGEQIGAALVVTGGFAWDPREKRVITVDGSDVVLWTFDPDEWAATACELAGRNMTRAEWDEWGPETVEYRATCPQFPIEE